MVPVGRPRATPRRFSGHNPPAARPTGRRRPWSASPGLAGVAEAPSWYIGVVSGSCRLVRGEGGHMTQILGPGRRRGRGRGGMFSVEVFGDQRRTALVAAAIVAVALLSALATSVKKTPRDQIGISYG